MTAPPASPGATDRGGAELALDPKLEDEPTCARAPAPPAPPLRRFAASLSLGGARDAAARGAPPTGSAATLAALMVTGVVFPTILSLPYAFAQLTWAGGLVALVAATASARLAAGLLAALSVGPGGRRHATYPALAEAAVGARWAGRLVAAFQVRAGAPSFFFSSPFPHTAPPPPSARSTLRSARST
jgi:hypothetical protein